MIIMINQFHEFKQKITNYQKDIVSKISKEEISEEHIRDSKTFIIWTIVSYIPLWFFITPFLYNLDF